jgi:hypothetical protein
VISAAVLRHLIVEPDWRVRARGVEMRSTVIDGRLDVTAATVRCPLRLEKCRLIGDQPIALDLATLPMLMLQGCFLPGIVARCATISKGLSLNGSMVAGPLVFRDAVIAGGMHCERADLTGTDDAGYALVGDGMTISGGLHLAGGFTSAGALSLTDAVVTGRLNCAGAILNGRSPTGVALDADRLRVSGGIDLTGASAPNGCISFTDAEVSGEMKCEDMSLEGTNHGGFALAADGLKVGSGLYLTRLRSKGAVDLRFAAITGQLWLRGTAISGTRAKDGSGRVESDGVAFAGDRLSASGGANFDGKFSTAGTVRLFGAEIEGPLSFRGAKLNTGAHSGTALVADGVKVTNALYLDGGFNPGGPVSLVGAEIGGDLCWEPDTRPLLVGRSQGRARCALSRHGRMAHERPLAPRWFRLPWPRWRRSVDLEGSIGMDSRPIPAARHAATRGWAPAGAQPTTTGSASPGAESPGAPASPLTRFAAQPYEQLASVYEDTGQDAESRHIRIAAQRDRRTYGALSKPARCSNWLFDKTIRYGYRAWRAVVALLVLYVVACGAFSIAQSQGNLIVPATDVTGLHPSPQAAHCTSRYPCFEPAGFALDVVVPNHQCP